MDTIKKLHTSVKTTILLPKGGGNPLGVSTSDGRPCISSPTNLPIPGSPGAPEFPGGSGGGDSNKDKYKTESDNNEEEEEEKEWDKNDHEGFENAKKNPKEFGSDFLDCKAGFTEIYSDLSMPLTAPGDFSMSGERVKCPANCAEKVDNKMLVIGPEQPIDAKSKKIYSIDSSICGAAIHSGMMSDAEGENIIMHLTKPRGPFKSLIQNNIESKEGIQAEIAV